ncbi:hypothetical protein EMB92_03545 [Bifidobacterium callitrichos]|uniref:Uncharacterized protein n=1 Tax=Bifidobacterium callitrichos TaxID=762209 RepID=A0A5M9ZF99_9BIFI|nr:TSUP family transporter [Bifidobacterium callitrichos]KAA8817629.1 hypothetical protein EMB92_03545 [Bifidobacterium callitrichos]
MVVGFSIVTLLLIMFAGIGAGIGGVVGAQHELKGQAARVAVYMAIGALGGVAGAFLLLELDEKVFEFAAPALILFSSFLTASVVFIARGAVDWPAAIMLCVGCFVGGCIAPPITRRIPANAMRWAAVIAGVILTVDLALKTYR